MICNPFGECSLVACEGQKHWILPKPTFKTVPNCRLHNHFALKPLFILYFTRRFKTEWMVLTIHRTIQPFKTKPYNIAIIVYTTLLTNPATVCVVHCKVYTYVCTYICMWCTVCAHVHVYSTLTCFRARRYRWMTLSLFICSSWPSS